MKIYRNTMIKKKKVLMSWSSGKDSAWALYKLQQDPFIDLVGLFSTVNVKFQRVAMHAVRLELVRQQAKSLGLPLEIIEIPYPCSHQAYENIMALFVEKSKKANIDHFAFGDLFLEEVRQYREELLRNTGITPIFPLWEMATDKLSRAMIAGNLRAVITCVNPKQIPEIFLGKVYNTLLLENLPKSVDPCGENGEFHSFVFSGPMFKKHINFFLGHIVMRDNFLFIDVLTKEKSL